ncbi:MAG: gliding motility-associated C-terminal domain-containing protein [Bacteroidales bacterium]|nr:gliding motility-associated C-terminal domain-containing protein [Bacteroidales bacterium]
MKKSLIYIVYLIFFAFLSSGLSAQTIKILSISKTDETCRNLDDGTITISVTGGTKPYVYHVVHGVDSRNSVPTTDTTYTFTNIWATSWIVFVEDDLNIADFGNITVNQPAPVTITSAVITPISCTGFNDGKINVTATGESGSYNFTLNPGPVATTTGSFSSLSPNTYTVTVTDATGCLSSAVTGPLVLSDPTPISVSSATATNITCNGLSNGIINVSGSGGTGALSYTLNPGAVATNGTGNFSGLGPGTYDVDITDGNTCPNANTGPLTIIDPPLLTISISSQTNVLCNGASTGSVTVTAGGGSPAYTYKIDAGAYGGSATFNGLSAGAHTVTVKDSKGCTASVAVNITQPPLLTGSISSQTNVLCFGSSTGSVTVTGAGGNGGYTYNINGGAFGGSGTFINLAAGPYTVQVKDGNGCTANVPVTITQPGSAVSGSITSQTNVLCFGASTGSVTVAGSGGTPAYTYNIDGGAFTASATFPGLAAGAHTVQVKDAGGCTANVAVNISQPASGVSGSITSQTNVLCFGSSTGSVTLSGAGGTPPYTFNMDGGAFTATTTYNNLSPGAHTAQVKDAGGCTSPIPINISQPGAALTVSNTSQTNVLCNGSSTGSVTVTGAGGTPAYLFKIDAGAYGAGTTFNGLAAGAHTVMIKDANNCTSSLVVNITQPPVLSGSITSQTNVLCFGSSTGSVTITGAGGNGGYTYNINGGAFGGSGTFTNLAAGPYTVQVKDANACTVNVPVTITQPASAVSGSISSQTNILCFGGSTGSVTVSGAGGVPSYLYNIDGGAFGASGTFPGLTAGPHSVQVKDSNGCTANVAVNLSQPAAALSISISSQTNVLCNGGSTGSVTVAGAGGTPAYTYNINGGAFAGPATFNSLNAGAYTVQVKDANSCTASVPVTITQPATLTSSTAKTDITCNGLVNGSVTITASGGTLPYQYSRVPFAYGGSNVFNGLSKNTYNFNTKDANGCISTSTATINEPLALAIPNEIKIDNNVCFGDTLGEVRILSVSGGIPPYQYSINGGISFFPTGIFQNLGAGNYQTVVKDANGCLKNGNSNTISQPSKIVINNYSQMDVTDCFGNDNGQIAIEAIGGTGSINYTLDGITSNGSGIFSLVGGGNHTIEMMDTKSCKIDTSVVLTEPDEMFFSVITITDVSGCNGNTNGSVSTTVTGGAGSFLYAIDGGAFQALGNFAGLAAGNHILSVQDANLCQKDTTISITEPALLSVGSQSSTNSSCGGADDASITVSASGGTAPYTYTLNPGALFTNNTGFFGALAPGSYMVDITDSQGCGPVTSANIDLTEPSILVRDSVISKGISCNGSSDAVISIYASGGTSPFNYSIDDELSYGAVSDFTALGAGTFHLSVKDFMGCTLYLDTIVFNEPTAIISISESKVDITSCSNDPVGEVDFQASGGTGSLEYSIDGMNWQASGNFTGLAGGDYTVTARDQNACMLNSSMLTVIAPVPITADISTTADLNEFNKGSITISNPAGGTGTLVFSITGAGGVFSAQTVYTGLDAGTYQLVIRDDNNCTLEQDVIVSSVPPLDITVTVVNSACNGDNSGSITLTSINGTDPIEYSIDDSASWQPAGNYIDLLPGTYYVFVRDAEMRYFQDTVLITEPLPINIFGNVTPSTCSSFSADGAIDVSVNGGKSPYTYSWSSGETSQDLNNINAGDYILTVTDSKFCTSEKTFTLPAITNVTANAGTDTTLCAGESITLDGQGGLTQSWLPVDGLSDPDISNPVVTIDSSMTYILTVVGFNDCQATDTINILVRPSLGLNAGNDTTIIKDQELTLVAGGGPFTSYSWLPETGLETPAEASTIAHPLVNTNYIVSAVTEFGCIESDTVLIRIAERLIVYDVFSPNNGDDLNNYFEIENASLYPGILVEVYTRWGEKLFSSKGYSDDQRWDGTFKGKDVPIGTYYYVIVPYKGAEAITGPLTIVR